MNRAAALMLVVFLASPAVGSAADTAQESAHEIVEEETGHGEHGDHGPLSITGVLKSRDFQGTVVNFLVLVLLIAWVIRTKGNPALAERRSAIEEELAEAQRLRAEAERRHMEAATRLEKLDQEMLQIRAEMIKAGEAERDRIVEEAEEKAARMRKDARFLIDQQVKQLRKDLTQQAANAAVLAAKSLLEESTTDADQDRLAEAYINRLDEVIEERQR